MNILFLIMSTPTWCCKCGINWNFAYTQCTTCKQYSPGANHFFGINEIYHSSMSKKLEKLKNDYKQNNINFITVPIYLKETVKKIAKEFEKLEGTGERNENIKSDLTPCSWHWPRFCENMVSSENVKLFHATYGTKKCCKDLDNKKVKYIKVTAGYESTYAIANTDNNTIIVYENYN